MTTITLADDEAKLLEHFLDGLNDPSDTLVYFIREKFGNLATFERIRRKLVAALGVAH
ncbi:MAG TPA: hypothetical protein VNJ51_10360 [Candidatus Dormibacteraeota bacterium]|nr:hypothetical protein [Candidatus Dormibacteraeota bacterium]